MIYAISLTLLTKPLVARPVMTFNQLSIEKYFKLVCLSSARFARLSNYEMRFVVKYYSAPVSRT